MDEFQKLEEMVKVYEKNVETLHRHLIGQNWFGDHEQLGDYYNHLFDDVIKDFFKLKRLVLS